MHLFFILFGLFVLFVAIGNGTIKLGRFLMDSLELPEERIPEHPLRKKPIVLSFGKAVMIVIAILFIIVIMSNYLD